MATIVTPPSVIKVQVGSQQGGVVTTINQTTNIDIVAREKAESAAAQANTANTVAIAAYVQANTATTIAQAAFNQANTGGGVAFTQAAYNQANTANIVAISAYVQANTSNSVALSAYDQANTATIIGQAAYATANLEIIGTAAYAQANLATLIGQSAYATANLEIIGTAAYVQANTATIIAQAAYEQANTSNTIASASFVQANTSNTVAIAAYVQANTATIIAQAAYAQANTGGGVAFTQAAYNQANTANIVAIAAYVQANTATIIGQASYIQVNTATIIAQSAYVQANTANIVAIASYVQANTATTIGTAAYVQANTSNTVAIAGYVQANLATIIAQAAFARANSEPIGTAAYVQANTASANTIYLQGGLDSANANIAYLLGNTSPKFYSTSVSPSVNSIAVGGAPVQNAQTWSTYTMVQVFDAILFPTIGPSYTIPTITLSANNTGTLEIGQTINQLLTVTGTKNDANAFTQLRINRNSINLVTNNSPTITAAGNVASQFGYPDPNNPNFSYATTHIDSNTIVSGTTTWTGFGNYGAGLAKLTNKGTTDTNAFAVLSTTNPQAANNANFATSGATVTGIYPYFWGVSATQPTANSIASAIQAGTETRVLAVGSGTLTITFNASSQYIWLAVQTGYAAKTAWYNTALNNGSIGAGQFILSPISQAVTSPSSYWSGVTYNIYISGYATTTSGSIQFS